MQRNKQISCIQSYITAIKNKKIASEIKLLRMHVGETIIKSKEFNQGQVRVGNWLLARHPGHD